MTGPRIGSLFSGYGGLDLGVQAVLGGETVWHVEFDENPSRILAHHWPDVPNYGDITSVDWSKVEPVDVLTGGFPCQDVSLAGARRGLRKGTRSGLWAEFARAIGELRPSLVLIENVRGLLSADGEPWHDELLAAADELARVDNFIGMADRFIHGNPARRKEGRSAYVDKWRRARVRVSRQRKRAVARFDRERRLVRRAIDTVFRDLADLGFDAEWGGVRAADAGAPHGRFRVFILAWPANSEGIGQHRGGSSVEPGSPDGRSGHASAERHRAGSNAADTHSEGRRPVGRRGGVFESDAHGRGAAGPRTPHPVNIEPVGESAEQSRRSPASRGGRDVDADSEGGRRGLRSAEDERSTSGEVNASGDAAALHPAGGAAQDADVAARRKRGQSAPVEAEGGRSRSHARGRGGASAPDSDGERRREGRAESARRVRGSSAVVGGAAAGHSDDAGLEGQGPSGERASERALGSDDLGSPARGGGIAADSGRKRSKRRGGHGDVAGSSGAGEVDGEERQRDGDAADDRGAAPRGIDWGVYARAIARWEFVTGRVAPAPTRPDGAKGQHRLSPLLVEWMMGLPFGWVTDPAIWVGMSDGAARNAQLKALGNGVVWQQAALALTLLLARRAQVGLAA